MTIKINHPGFNLPEGVPFTVNVSGTNLDAASNVTFSISAINAAQNANLGELLTGSTYGNPPVSTSWSFDQVLDVWTISVPVQASGDIGPGGSLDLVFTPAKGVDWNAFGGFKLEAAGTNADSSPAISAAESNIQDLQPSFILTGAGAANEGVPYSFNLDASNLTRGDTVEVVLANVSSYFSTGIVPVGFNFGSGWTYNSARNEVVYSVQAPTNGDGSITGQSVSFTPWNGIDWSGKSLNFSARVLDVNGTWVSSAVKAVTVTDAPKTLDFSVLTQPVNEGGSVSLSINATNFAEGETVTITLQNASTYWKGANPSYPSDWNYDLATDSLTFQTTAADSTGSISSAVVNLSPVPGGIDWSAAGGLSFTAEGSGLQRTVNAPVIDAPRSLTMVSASDTVDAGSAVSLTLTASGFTENEEATVTLASAKKYLLDIANLPQDWEYNEQADTLTYKVRADASGAISSIVSFSPRTGIDWKAADALGFTASAQGVDPVNVNIGIDSPARVLTFSADTTPINAGEAARLLLDGSYYFKDEQVTVALQHASRYIDRANPPSGWEYNLGANELRKTFLADAEGRIRTVDGDGNSVPVVIEFTPKVGLDWTTLQSMVFKASSNYPTGVYPNETASVAVTDTPPTIQLFSDVALEAVEGTEVNFTLVGTHLHSAQKITISVDNASIYGINEQNAPAGWVYDPAEKTLVKTIDAAANGTVSYAFSFKLPTGIDWTSADVNGQFVLTVQTARLATPVQDAIDVKSLPVSLALTSNAQDGTVKEGAPIEFTVTGTNIKTTVNPAEVVVTVTVADLTTFFADENAATEAGWTWDANNKFLTKTVEVATGETTATFALTPLAVGDFTVSSALKSDAGTTSGAYSVNVVARQPSLDLTPHHVSVIEGNAVAFSLTGEDLTKDGKVTVTLADALKFFADKDALDAAGWTLAEEGGSATKDFSVGADRTINELITLTPSATHDWSVTSGLQISVVGAGVAVPVIKAVKVGDIHVPVDGNTTVTLSGNLADYSLVYAADQVIIAHNTDGTLNDYVGFDRINLADGAIDLQTPSWLFDPVSYATKNLDVYKSGLGSFEHFERFGEVEGRNPNDFFNAKAYLAVNKDVAAVGVTAFDHYVGYGAAEGRDTNLNFDVRLYLQNNEDVAKAGIGALEHYLQYGQLEGRATYTAISDKIAADGFDEQYYLFANADVVAAGVDARAHFAQTGYAEGRLANAFFDPAYYLENNADVKNAHIDPLTHYNEFGWREGRAASAQFDTQVYLDNYSDVAAADINPLKHYLEFGIYENRSLDDVHSV